ncbi:hypothetical protein As57867_018283, partial [Aphanomyces stellatus]
MARQNKRNKSSETKKDDGKGHAATGGKEDGRAPAQTFYVQLLVDDAALLHHSHQLKDVWAPSTAVAWDEDESKRQESIVLLTVDISSAVQLDVLKDVLTTGTPDALPPLEATCRLQVENSGTSGGGKSLRLVLQLSDATLTFLAKACESTLRLLNHSIDGQYGTTQARKLRHPRHESFRPHDTQETSRPRPLDLVGDINRQGWRGALSLQSVVLGSTHTPSSALSTWAKQPVASDATTDSTLSELHSHILHHVSLDAPIVVIMRGRPGSGKSTLTRVVESLARFHDRSFRLCSADHYFDSPAGYYHNKNDLSAAHDACKASFAAALAAAVDVVVVDNTNSCLWEYDQYRADALASRYRVCVLEVSCDDIATAMRMALRNSHGVSMDVVLRMHQRWEPHVVINAAADAESHVVLPPVFSAADNRRAVPLLLHGGVSSTYIAAVYFSDATRAALLARFPPQHATVVAEHMTLAFQPAPGFEIALGQVVRLAVTEERFDAKGHCLRLTWVDNPVPVDDVGQRIPHTTLSFPPGSAAYYSNELLALEASAPGVTIRPLTDDTLMIEGRVGAALAAPSLQKWRKARLLNLPSTDVVEARRQLTLVYAPDVVVNGAFDRDDETTTTALVSEIERVGVRGNVLVLAASHRLDEILACHHVAFDHILDCTDAFTVQDGLHQSLREALAMVPDATSIQVISTASVVAPLIAQPLPLSIHLVTSLLPRRLSSSLVFAQFRRAVADQICGAWAAICHDTFVDASVSPHDDCFDVYLSTTGHAPLDGLVTRLVEALRHHHMQLCRGSGGGTGDHVEFLDVCVSDGHTIQCRVVAFVADSSSSTPSLHEHVAALLATRPAATCANQARLAARLAATPLPFCDLPRATRVLAAS